VGTFQGGAVSIRTTTSSLTTALCLLAILLTSCTTDRTRRAYLRENAAQFIARPSHPVIVIPGFGVSRLLDPETGRHVWGTPRSVVRSGWPDDLDLPFDPSARTIGQDRLVPDGFAGSRGPVNTAFQLVNALERYGGYEQGADVYAFAYDWRLSAMANAERLEQFATEVRRKHRGVRVDVVTHSAGGIVALTWVKLGAGGDDVRNLVMLSPPAAGTIEAFRMLVRPERFVRRSFGPAFVATWPSVPELLPANGRVFIGEEGHRLDFDLWTPATWRQFAIADPALAALFAASLERAHAFRQRLAGAAIPEGVTVHLLAGDCVPTARAVLLRRDGTFAFYPAELRPGEEHLRQHLFEPGDGTITVSSAVAAPAEAQLFCDGHQGIAADPNVHRAILRILRERSLLRSGMNETGDDSDEQEVAREIRHLAP
jgi:hypothetical protein